MDESRAALMSRWEHVQSYLFPWMREDLDPCTEALERLIIVLDTIGLEAYVPGPPRCGRGRKPDDRRALARAFVAKAVLGIPTTAALIERLATDKSLRRICAWETRREVPSEATFSRAFAEFAQSEMPGQLHEALVKRSLGGRVVGCIARDATEIEAREKPVRKDEVPSVPPQAQPCIAGHPDQRTDESPSAPPLIPVRVSDPRDPSADDPPPDPPQAPAQAPRKRGRPKKGEVRAKEPTRLERQQNQTFVEMLADLPSHCDVGTKTNSKGYKESWVGYKLHIDVANGQIPVSCILTSASVHDSQVAIPLMALTGQRITYLYEIMDSAYDAAGIIVNSRSRGHVPIVDHNFRSNTDIKAEAKAEAERRALIHMPDPDQAIYNFRTMVERINARLKDEFGGRFIRVRGAIKVKCHLMFGMLALTVDQIFRAFKPAPA